jgi:dihydrofolate reductase
MSKVRVAGFGLSLDGFSAGIEQSLGDPLGRRGGGVSTVRQYLQAGLIDSVHLALVPVLLGQGEPLLHGLDLHALGFCVTDRKASEYATHFVLEKVAIQS